MQLPSLRTQGWILFTVYSIATLVGLSATKGDIIFVLSAVPALCTLLSGLLTSSRMLYVATILLWLIVIGYTIYRCQILELGVGNLSGYIEMISSGIGVVFLLAGIAIVALLAWGVSDDELGFGKKIAPVKEVTEDPEEQRVLIGNESSASSASRKSNKKNKESGIAW
jgi:hypothetical protein